MTPRIVPGAPASVLVPTPRVSRRPRAPIHDFLVRFRPFQLQPVMCAPVLPGDTLKNYSCNFSARTDPVKHPLIGWWFDMHTFYVPMRAMDIASYMETMVLDPAFGELSASADIAADPALYHAQATKPSFTYWALKAIVEEYFRYEGETWLTGTPAAALDTLPQIGITKKNAISSFILDSASSEPDQVPGQIDPDELLSAQMGTTLATQFSGALDAYQALVSAQVVDVTFEDWLLQYGVKLPIPDNDPRPERIGSYSDWKFPTKAIDETDGSLASALYWRDRVRFDKDRRFKEPGVIITLACATPKIYLKNQTEAVIDSLTRSLDWLPAVLAEEAFTSLKLFTSNGAGTGIGPLAGKPSADYWLDMRDLFVHGDQFVNFALSATDASIVDLPSANGATRFVSSTDCDNLFAAASPLNKIEAEGRIRLNYLSSVTDMTPNM